MRTPILVLVALLVNVAPAAGQFVWHAPATIRMLDGATEVAGFVPPVTATPTQRPPGFLDPAIRKYVGGFVVKPAALVGTHVDNQVWTSIAAAAE